MTIYTQEFCAPCKTAKYFFTKKNIDYEERDFVEYYDKLRSRGFGTSPVFEIGDYMTTNLSKAMTAWEKQSS